MLTSPLCGPRPLSIFSSLNFYTSRGLFQYATIPSRHTFFTFRQLHQHASFVPPTPFQRSPSNRYATNTTATRVVHNPHVNPPASTLPAPLVLPTRTPDQGTFSYYYSLGRAYLTFYKTGLKAIYSNFQNSRKITAALPQGTTVSQAVSQGLLTRSDFQVVRRNRHDIARIPIFALVFCIFGEFTPLVVIFVSGVVPRTCRIPKQVVGAREKAERRRSESFRSGLVTSPPPSASSPAKAAVVPGKGYDNEIAELGREEILHIGRSLGLFSTWWDKLGLGPPVGLVKGRAKKRLEYLDQDDFLIRKNGGVEAMEMEEVRFALEERGLDVLGKNDVQLRGLLRSWLRELGRGPVTRLLLMRPSIWAKEK